MSERILVTIKDGKATVTSKGFAGTACLKATAAIERALGATTGDVATAEMHQQAEAKIEQGSGS